MNVVLSMGGGQNKQCMYMVDYILRYILYIVTLIYEKV